MKLKRNWIRIIVSLGLLAVVAVSASMAYYYHLSERDNRLMTTDSTVFLSEIFNPGDQWVPGETKQKEVCFGNYGDRDQVLRVKVTEGWYTANGAAWSFTGASPANINWTNERNGGPNTAHWVKIGDYYYYRHILKAPTGSATTVTTPNMIDSVSFSDQICNGGPDSNGRARTDFSNKRYSLTVEAETVDVNPDITYNAWGLSFTRNGDDVSWS